MYCSKISMLEISTRVYYDLSCFITSQIRILCLFYIPVTKITEFLLFAGENKNMICYLREK